MRVLRTHSVALCLCVSAFVLHLAWENAHLGLYESFEGISGPIPVLLYATMGDVAYTLAAVLLLSWMRREYVWLREPSRHDYTVLAGMGVLIALFVEYKALALARWTYTAEMPIVPLLDVGFSPLVQMALLLPLSVYFASTFANWLQRRTQ